MFTSNVDVDPADRVVVSGRVILCSSDTLSWDDREFYPI